MKNKIFKITRLSLIILSLIAIIAISIIYKFNITSYYITITILSILAITELILILINLLTDNSYDFSNLILMTHASYLISAVLFYYVVKYFKHYDKYNYLYWIGLISVSLIVSLILILIDKKNSKKAKIKVNTNRA